MLQWMSIDVATDEDFGFARGGLLLLWSKIAVAKENNCCVAI